MSTNIQENFSKIDLNQNNNEKENIPPLSTKYTHFNKTHQSDEVHTSCIDANKNTRTNFYRYEIYIKEDFKNFSKTKNGPISDQLENCHLGVNFINDNNSAIYAISKSASHSTRTLKINDPSDASDDLRYIRLSNNNDPIEENLDENENENSVPSSVHYILPNKNFIGLWESLIYNDDNLKPKLYNFMKTINSFSLKNVDSNLVSLNKLILLHGLPGSGKTSLCKALAQKLTVELVSQEANQTYKYGQLIEINCHSLFSKWFSESGKLVMKQFQNIRDMALDQSCIIFVLIDEIESIAGKRSAVDTGTEPSDSIRVVNAVLTQLDSLKDYKNVLCLSTSNLIEKIDEALLFWGGGNLFF